MLIILVFIFGLIIGSFLNVVICRLKTKEPIFFSRSYCPKCRAVLKWFDLIPVLSFLFKKGKCSYCDKEISWQYPLVELATGALFVLALCQFSSFAGKFDFFNFFYYLLIICFLLIIFVYDLKHYIIPDKIVFPAILLVLVIKIIARFVFDSDINWFSDLLATFSASGFFLFLVLISKGKWMGLGDVKLAILMGLVLGWPNILLALFLSFFVGAIVGLGLIAFGKKCLKSEVPFGPFLAGATIFVMLGGSYFSNWLNSLFYF
ncbi:MAG: prepilin peptidase [bacterium]